MKIVTLSEGEEESELFSAVNAETMEIEQVEEDARGEMREEGGDKD